MWALEGSAEKNLGEGGVHRQFLVVGDPHTFLDKAPLVYSFYYDQGHRNYEKVGHTEAVLTTHDAETFTREQGWHSR